MAIVGQERQSKRVTQVHPVKNIIFVLVIVLMTTVSAAIINRVNQDNGKELARAYSVEAAQAFYSFISEDLTLVRKASHSKAITNWFADEENKAKKILALDEMMNYAEIVPNVHLYLAIHESKNEYTTKGQITMENIVPFAQLDPDNITDVWYYECIESENDYVTNIDIEKHTNIMRLWINHKVKTDKEIVGVFCSGLIIQDIHSKLFGKLDARKFRGYVINKEGIIQLDDKSIFGLYIDEPVRYIQKENDNLAFNEALFSHLNSINGFFTDNSQSHVVRLSNRLYKYAAIEPIKSTDWSIVIFYNPTLLAGTLNFLPLVFVLLVVLFLYVIRGNTLTRKVIFSPMNRLIQNRLEKKTNTETFYSKDKNIEEGKLLKILRNSGMKRINLPYARVLVVDDVKTNLYVAKGMMKPYGMQVDCVTSGQEAVDAIRSETVQYNAIFMDHMMPGMDGIEATKIIREEIGTEYAKTIPIIALTANVTAGNEEKFLEKGFQAFLSKPIEIELLDSVIRQWVMDKTLEEEQSLPNPTDAEKANQPEKTEWVFLKHIEGIDLEKGLERFSGDIDIFMNILRSYTASTSTLIKAIKELNQDNMSDYAITVHGIKGSSKSICAELVGNMAEALEKAARRGDLDYVLANNNAFVEAVEKLIGNLINILHKAGFENQKPLKDKPDKYVLDRLQTACKTYSMDEIDEAMEELEKYEYKSDDGLVSWLRTNVNQVNFVQICKKLSDLSMQPMETK